ncbi:Casein kinase I protein isoform 1 [Hibiscus syriacus]|uniref:Casein kinase I protein isoform 1 n=1 Tax=Hibiscus syriacus TaxID=106335 RepID=A0A6A2ZZD3_HIBSY|nr:uncharacterized protein LOC120137613 [Hibiscus syriacus]KAE8696432.1 Casein kinase I protein isoform 1 [Hibiscus syriacus]
MEQNLPVINKRVWSTVRAVLFIVRKGSLTKKKFIVDLNMLLKRGKIAIANLMLHDRRRHQVSSSSLTAESKGEAIQEYEFSCSNTPDHIFPFNLKNKNHGIHNYYHQLFACVHAPPTHDDDNSATVNAAKAVLDMLNNNDSYSSNSTASPMLPGFGQTPLARQLRITDSPFPLRDGDEDNSDVDKAAEDFINRFYRDLKQQNNTLSES